MRLVSLCIDYSVDILEQLFTITCLVTIHAIIDLSDGHRNGGIRQRGVILYICEKIFPVYEARNMFLTIEQNRGSNISTRTDLFSQSYKILLTV